MNWQALGAVSDFIAAIAVILTLGYLAIQIRQNTKAIAGASIDSITNHGFQELRWAAELLELHRKAESDPDSLTEIERRKIVIWGLASIRNRQNEYFQWKHGSLRDEVWRASESILPGIILGNSVVRTWFESPAAKQVFAGDFYEHVSRLVRDADADFVSGFRSYSRRDTTGAA